MEIPIIPKVISLHIHTGNVVNWNKLQKTIIKEPSDEVRNDILYLVIKLKEYISSTLSSWLILNKQNIDRIQDISELKLYGSLESNSLNEDDRESHKVTVKLFLNEISDSTIEDAISSVLEELGTNHIETVLICLPLKMRSQENLVKCWSVLERMHSKLKVFSFGTVDLTQPELESFYNAVEKGAAICYSTLTDILEHKSLQNIISSNLTVEDGKGWNAKWIVRYSVLIKCRGIIASKAYIIGAERSIKPENFI